MACLLLFTIPGEECLSDAMTDYGTNYNTYIHTHIYIREATMSALHSKWAAGYDANPDVDGDDGCKAKGWRHQYGATLRRIIAGAIRTPHRLFAAGLAESPKCPHCSCPRCDAAHLFWECSHFATEREEVTRTIDDTLGRL